MLIQTVSDVTDKNELNGIRAIIFHFKTDKGGRSVTQPGKRGTSYAQYESNALAAMIKAGYKLEPKWTFVAAY